MSTMRLASGKSASRSLRISFKKAFRFLLVGFVLLASIQFFLATTRTVHDREDKHVGGIYNQLLEFRNDKTIKVVGQERNKERGTPSLEQLEVQRILRRSMNRTSLSLTAYTEEPLKIGIPLPPRVRPKLQKYIYPDVMGCRDLQNYLPVHHPKEVDDTISPIFGQLNPIYPVRYDYAAKFCPVDADPFLPWIHDILLNDDGTYMDIVAHNKRRCRTSPDFADDLKNLEPQVALFQSVPVKRIPPENQSAAAGDNTSYRYRLASLEEADDDAKETRFICRFHTLRPNDEDDSIKSVIVGETLSVFPYNYEHANYQKGPGKIGPLLTRPQDGKDVHGAHNERIWNAILHFRCPVPEAIQNSLQTNPKAFQDVPEFYVDLVPIRTPPRENPEGYCPQLESTFQPDKEWGKHHTLPPVEESGRWANIPVCRPTETHNRKKLRRVSSNKQDAQTTQQKNNYLVGCLWASAGFSTRGSTEIDTSTAERLLEWLTYHLKVAKFDHIYIYDNSEAHSNTASLESIINLFPPHLVTRIPWKHRVCNNNKPMHRNIGERSSQYAAEASCRLRYGPSTEWLISFDTDEYLIPQSNWPDLKSWLVESVKNGKIGKDTHILSFFQTRALPNVDYMDPYKNDGNAAKCRNGSCLKKKDNVTFLEAYDCEQTALPKPDYGWRAKKQIYRPEFVLNHFVHYSTVTRRIHEAPHEWSPLFKQKEPYERRVDELTEAFMLHTKTTNPSATADWKNKCRDPKNPKNCPVGIPFPILKMSQAGNHSAEGLVYNCYPHERVQDVFKPKLERLLGSFQKKGS